jgi:hypothetical protein
MAPLGDKPLYVVQPLNDKGLGSIIARDDPSLALLRGQLAPYATFKEDNLFATRTIAEPRVQAAGGKQPTVRVRFDGTFSGTITVDVECTPGAAGPSRGGNSASSVGNLATTRQYSAIGTPVSVSPFGFVDSSDFSGPRAVSVQTSGSEAGGCGPLLVLAVILLLMALAAGGTGLAATGASFAGGNAAGITSVSAASAVFAPAQARAAYGQQPTRVLRSGVIESGQVGQPTGMSQVGSQPATQFAAQSAAPVYMASSAPASQFQGGSTCPRNDACPGNCPVAPFCGGQPPFKGICEPQSGARIVYFPGQAGYLEAQVGLSLVDAYFCDYNATLAAGFMPAR